MTAPPAYWRELRHVIADAERFGRRKLRSGAEVYGWYPAPPGEDLFTRRHQSAWLHHIVFPPLTADELDALTSAQGRNLPGPLCAFLQGASNGVDLYSGELVIYGLRRTFTRDPDELQPFHLPDADSQFAGRLLERGRDVDDDLLFIGAWRSSVTPLALRESDGSIVALDRDTGEACGAWQDLADLLTDQARQLAVLFDQQGRRVDDVPARLVRDRPSRGRCSLQCLLSTKPRRTSWPA
jgi:hypothetical protein